jgi:hypothetical protein
MKDKDHEFAIRKYGRELRWLSRFLGSFFKIALLAIALGLYWQWNHGDPGIGPILLCERKLATANATYFVSAFGLRGSAALIAAVLVAALRFNCE